MAPSNLTNLTSATGFTDVVRFANNQTDGIVAKMFILAIFVIILMVSLRRYKFIESLLVASFFGFALSIPLVILQWLAFWVMLSFGTLMVVSGYITYVTKDDY